ncbi:MAG: GrpB family protein [Gemmatimonadaceae bacterium]|nr:GrpB family protein [Gemmatimonadaceae bacterium]
MPKAVVVVPYDPSWGEAFAQLHTALWPVVADVATSIEHVGSTAIPGLAAKPVLDIDVVVPGARIPEAVARLVAIGYVHRGDLGIPGREAMRRPPQSVAHHLYVCDDSSPALRNHLAVRDALRADSARAAAYGALKQRLAREHPTDMDAYLRGKTAFLVALLRDAGFPEATLDEIAQQNGLRGAPR